MKNFKISLISGVLALSAGMVMTSCDDKLDLSPIDYYGSGNYWTSEANVNSYIDGLHSNLRGVTWQHTMVFGEFRGGQFKTNGVSADNTQMANTDIKTQAFDDVHTGVSKFGDLYGRITNLNLMIKRTNEASYMTEDAKQYYLAVAYGLRAFYYFDLYRIYGGVPLRLGIEVIEGNIDPASLYLKRAEPSEVMAQIKSDLDKSLECFNNSSSDWDPKGHGKKVVWSKAATECLMGEVYLWNAKVTIGDNKANEADLAVAKTHLLNVMNNYGLSLQPKFSSVFDANNKSNSEIIMAVRYKENEAENSNGYFTYSITTGALQPGGYYTEDAEGNMVEWNNPYNLNKTYLLSHEYNTKFVSMFDKADSRYLATFTPAYEKQEDGTYKLFGSTVCKNIGYINTAGVRIFCGDYILYRLPWVYLSLAEIANMEGNGADVAKYINLVRERAYGANWNEATYGYTASDFTTNEYAILHEKDKEFVQEGQRWFDLCRMTETKGGKHLVFCAAASVEGDAPVLNEATEAYKVLWPLDKTLLSNDPELVQTPGYTD